MRGTVLHGQPTMKPNLLCNPAPGRKILPPLVAAFFFFGFLWLLDFPKPFIDDLFYTGAGMNLADGGDLSNPFAVRYFPGQHFFFAYPPVHSYALAGWLKIFGISAAAMTGFQIAIYFSITVAIIAILYRNEAPVWMAWLVPLAVTTFLEWGLRPEAPAAALTWIGFAIIECGARKGPVVFFALLLMFLAGATAPRNAIFDVALILLAGWRLWRDPTPNTRPRWHLVIPGMAAFATAFLIFLLMIHFKFGEFWAVFRRHSSAYNTGDHTGIWQYALLTLGGIMGVFAWRYRSDRLMQICIVVSAAFAIALVTRTLGFGPGGWHALLIMMLLSATLIKHAPRAVKLVVPAALVSLLLWKNIPIILQVYGILAGQIKPDRGNQFETARALTSTPKRQLFVDPIVARYTFDYRIPQGSIDFPFAAPFPKVGQVMPDLMAGAGPHDTYLLSPPFHDYVEKTTYLEHQTRERWSWGHWSFDRYPRKVYIIPAEECKGLKPDTLPGKPARG